MNKTKKIIFLEKTLAWMAKRLLNRYQPKVIAITGSVGKTTTKKAVFTLLKHYFEVRQSEKNYNNEIGVPLTIIGTEPGKSLLGWLWIGLKWIKIYLIKGNYPEVLILEMGADRPGDINYLCKLAPPDVGILTNVGISHLKYFKNRKELIQEKKTLLKNVKTNGLAIINLDDESSGNIRDQLSAQVISYAIDNKEADMSISDILLGYRKITTARGKVIHLTQGAFFKLNFKGKIIPVKLKYGLGKSILYASLIAFSVGEYFKINLVEAAQKLEKFIPARGRLLILAGIKNTVLIDDTYNSAPDSLQIALEAFEKTKGERKILVLGDMLELGKEEEIAHKKAGEMANNLAVDILITVGKRMALAFKEFKKEAPQKKAFHFESPMKAGRNLQAIMKEGDVILIKGSQGMRMEKVIEEIMLEPNKKEKLLVRQDETWKDKKFIQP